ncbi:MAG: hypothetical protein S4CHLAM7_08610 [Chlamydiae bacterium]|nr:hypothetical protein [Chlamydiota bacterium]
MDIMTLITNHSFFQIESAPLPAWNSSVWLPAIGYGLRRGIVDKQPSVQQISSFVGGKMERFFPTLYKYVIQPGFAYVEWSTRTKQSVLLSTSFTYIGSEKEVRTDFAQAAIKVVNMISTFSFWGWISRKIIMVSENQIEKPRSFFETPVEFVSTYTQNLRTITPSLDKYGITPFGKAVDFMTKSVVNTFFLTFTASAAIYLFVDDNSPTHGPVSKQMIKSLISDLKKASSEFVESSDDEENIDFIRDVEMLHNHLSLNLFLKKLYTIEPLKELLNWIAWKGVEPIDLDSLNFKNKGDRDLLLSTIIKLKKTYSQEDFIKPVVANVLADMKDQEESYEGLIGGSVHLLSKAFGWDHEIPKLNEEELSLGLKMLLQYSCRAYESTALMKEDFKQWIKSLDFSIWLDKDVLIDRKDLKKNIAIKTILKRERVKGIKPLDLSKEVTPFQLAQYIQQLKEHYEKQAVHKLLNLWIQLLLIYDLESPFPS